MRACKTNVLFWCQGLSVSEYCSVRVRACALHTYTTTFVCPSQSKRHNYGYIDIPRTLCLRCRTCMSDCASERDDTLLGQSVWGFPLASYLCTHPEVGMSFQMPGLIIMGLRTIVVPQRSILMCCLVPSTRTLPIRGLGVPSWD